MACSRIDFWFPPRATPCALKPEGPRAWRGQGEDNGNRWHLPSRHIKPRRPAGKTPVARPPAMTQAEETQPRHQACPPNKRPRPPAAPAASGCADLYLCNVLRTYNAISVKGKRRPHCAPSRPISKTEASSRLPLTIDISCLHALHLKQQPTSPATETSAADREAANTHTYTHTRTNDAFLL